MGKVRAAIAAVAGLLVIGSGVPAFAADEPLTVTSTGMTDGQAVGGQFRFHPTWTGGATVTKVAVYTNGHLGHTSIRWADGLPIPGTFKDGETILVTVRVYDTAGAWAEASTTVVEDDTYPTAKFSPAIGTFQHGTITVTANNASDDTAQFALISPAGQTVAVTTSAPWTLTYDSVGGPSRVGLVLTDRAGNTTVPGAGYTFDNNPPVIHDLEFISGPQGNVKGWTQILVPFGSTSGINHDEWRINGELVESEHPLPSSWTYHAGLLSYDFGTQQRTVQLQVLAHDQAGMESTRTFTIVVDCTGPTITSVTPANGALVRGSRITSTVHATDPAGVADAVLNKVFWSNAPDPLTQSIPAGKDGRKTLTWKIHDELLNETVITEHVIVDNTPPAVTITKAPANGANVTGTVTITGSASDRNGINRVELIVNGEVVAHDTRTNYRFTLNTNKYGKTIHVRLRAYDNAGNRTTSATRTWHQ